MKLWDQQEKEHRAPWGVVVGWPIRTHVLIMTRGDGCDKGLVAGHQGALETFRSPVGFDRSARDLSVDGTSLS